MLCFFASDLHGRVSRWESLLARVAAERPAAVFLGGDLGPHPLAGGSPGGPDGFLPGWLAPRLRDLRRGLGAAYPAVPTILGNDDPGVDAEQLSALEAEGLLAHVHLRRLDLPGRAVYGCAWVPPTPFQLKDWERYDVGRGVDPGCVSPEEGRRTVPVPANVLRWSTIAGDLDALVGDADLADAVFLFHAPPYRTALDRAALDGRRVDHVPLDVHIGSVAIRNFLEARGPAIALCGHVHESTRLTGRWRDRVGRTRILGAAHDGPELALVRFDPSDPDAATRELIG
ncbi:MAG: metallophosphoesterase [Candidatus Krumholzibacteriia bacterium]